MRNASVINVIVPMYNVAKYLPVFLESVLAQTYENYRIFIVDDCSTDHSKDILKQYAPCFGEKLICLFNDRNEKLGQTRNHGLEVAENYPSDYTIFMDSDDSVTPEYLESMVRKAEETNADMVICGMDRIEDESGKIICVEAVNGSQESIHVTDAKDNFAFINPAAYNKLLRSSCITGVRFKRMLRSEDTCYLLEILPRIKTVVYTGVVSYHYRIRRDSLTGAFGKEVCQSMYQGFAEMAELYKQTEYEPFYEVLETQVFIRSLVGGVSRVSFTEMKKCRKNIGEAYEYMNTVFPNWKKNPYLCFGKQHSRNKKEIALKLCAYMYRTHTFGLFVYIYYFMLKILKIDVRM